MRSNSMHLLAHIRLQVIEAVKMGRLAGNGSHLLCQTLAKFVLLHFQQAAICVVDDNEFLRVEQVVGDDQRPQRIFGGDATSVADHVGVARFQTETILKRDTAIHAGQDGNLPLWAVGKLAEVEVARENFVGL